MPFSPFAADTDSSAGFVPYDELVFEVVKPYNPNPDIKWDEVNCELDALQLQFKDPVVAGEFQRFLQRDFGLLLIYPLSVIGLVAGALLTSTGYYAIINYVCAAFTVVFMVLEAVLHLRYRNTLFAARLRRAIQMCQAVAIVIGCTFAIAVGYDNCADRPKILNSLGFNRPETTLDRQSMYCQNIVNTFSLIILTILVNFTLTPLLYLAIVVILLICQLFTLGIVPGSTATEVIVKLQVLLCVASGALCMLSLRHRTLSAQFLQSIDVIRQTMSAEKSTEDLDLLLCSMLPPSSLFRLISGEEKYISDSTDEASVLFSDIVQFTAWSSHHSSREVTEMLSILCVNFDRLSATMNVEKVKTIGDAYWAVSGLPEYDEAHAVKLVAFGQALLNIVDDQNHRHSEWDGIRIRVGIHSGPLAGGIFGTSQLSYEVHGPTCRIANACESHGQPSRVAISRETYLLWIEGSGLADSIPPPNTTFEIEDETADTGKTTIDLFYLPRSGQQDHRPSVTSRKFSESGSSRRRSANVTSGVASQEQRRRFLSANAKKTAEAQERHQQKMAVEAMSEDAIRRKFSNRKWSWILLSFEDTEAERKYSAFTASSQVAVQRASRIFSILLLFSVVFSIVIQDGEFTPTTIPMFILAGLLWAADLLLSYRQSVPAALRVSLHHAGAICLFIAAGLTPVGSSVATNDITYLHNAVSLLVSMGNVSMVPSALLVMFNLVFFVPIVIGLIWHTEMVLLSIVFLFLSNIAFATATIIMEKKFRQQFLELRISEHFHEVRQQRLVEQQALLRSIVPPHIVDDLVNWISLGQDNAMTKVSEDLCIAFVTLHETIEFCSLGSENRSSAPGIEKINRDLCVLRNQSAATGAKTNIENSLTMLDSRTDWFHKVHRQVDDILNKFPAIDKIKTVGDLVIFAGCFTDAYSPSQAADQLLAAVSEMRGVADITAGLNCGHVVGTVLGLSRLCFDLFGDNMNFASRLMSTGERGSISASKSFVDVFGRRSHPDSNKASNSFCLGASFSVPERRMMKGLGKVPVFTVDTFPLVSIPCVSLKTDNLIQITASNSPPQSPSVCSLASAVERISASTTPRGTWTSSPHAAAEGGSHHLYATSHLSVEMSDHSDGGSSFGDEALPSPRILLGTSPTK